MNLSFDDKIKLALSECRGIWTYSIDHKFNYIYPFTTENLAAYMPKLTTGSQSMLTVGSSGDQTLNAILANCHNITILDICPFAEYYFSLKLSGIQSLNREEYIAYFSFNSYTDKGFNKKTYLKIREALTNNNYEAANFWDYLYKRYTGTRIHRRLFTPINQNIDKTTSFNSYLMSNEAYNELRHKLLQSHIDFQNEDIFTANINQKYDNINLSNLTTYYNPKAIKQLFNKMIPSLNDGGSMLISYLYEVSNDDLINNLDNNPLIKDILMVLPKNIDLYSFSSIYGDDLSDTIITYKKVKKI